MIFGSGIAGILEVELTSAEIEAALTAINSAGIALAQLSRKSELVCTFSIRRSQYHQLRLLCKKRAESLRIVRSRGLYWSLKKLYRRPLLLVGISAVMLLVLMIPTRVYFIRVEGNETIPDNRILAAAEYCGICFGASRREVRSEKIKNALLSELPQLQWAGVNTYGCTAVISVREGAKQEDQPDSSDIVSIVAERDGFILSGTVVQGNAVFQPGQAVKKGQVLISAYTDCGFCIRAERAEGEILALTNRFFSAVTPSECGYYTEIPNVKRKISVIFRKKRINLWKDSGISDDSCGRMYKEYYVALPGGFRLPVALCVETYAAYDMQWKEIPQEDVETMLSKAAGEYLSDQMVAGTIQSKTELITLEEGVYQLAGKYVCVEMIGRQQREQIGDTNGKNS